MTSQTALLDVNVEGYCFHRSDGKPFDPSVLTFKPPFDNTVIGKPQAEIIEPDTNDSEDDGDGDWKNVYHVCDSEKPPSSSFILANRCEPAWSALSDQQKDVIKQIEDDVNDQRKAGVYFRSAIMEGMGGCGKTRLMAYVMNHSPRTTDVIYMTKQNKRLQDFLHDEIGCGEVVSPRPVEDMSKWSRDNFNKTPRPNHGGRYACTVDKLIYNKSARAAATRSNRRETMQWQLDIPDVIFGKGMADRKGNTVVLLDEYTMISPPQLHKMIHCIKMLFDKPTVLIMGGDRFQLGPIDWDAQSDKYYGGKRGEEAPHCSMTDNNEYYVSDVRKELTKRLGQSPFEYHMVGSQRCRDDPELAKIVLYLRKSCEKKTSVKAIERRLVAFGRARGIHLYRYDENQHKTGRLMFDSEEDDELFSDDDDDQDRHLSDFDSRDEIDSKIDWSTPPLVDMTPFIDFYQKLYDKIYTGYNDGTLNDAKLPHFVYENASYFARSKFPVFMVKKNDKCNMLSDTFIKTLYNGVYTELVEKYAASETAGQRITIKALLEKLCVSLTMASQSPVQQTIMTGIPYRMTETIKRGFSKPAVSNGEIVLLSGIEFDVETPVMSHVIVKPLQKETGCYILVTPGFTQNRLIETAAAGDSFAPASVKRHEAEKQQQQQQLPPPHPSVSLISRCSNKRAATAISDCEVDMKKARSDVKATAFMLPMVPMVCENIYQLQGNTIVSDCFIDLLSTKSDDIYVAVSRFQKTNSIKGIILSK